MASSTLTQAEKDHTELQREYQELLRKKEALTSGYQESLEEIEARIAEVSILRKRAYEKMLALRVRFGRISRY